MGAVALGATAVSATDVCNVFYVLLPYILYVIKSGCFSQSPAFFS